MDDVGAGLQQHRVADAHALSDRCVLEALGEAGDALLVGAGHDEDPVVAQDLLDRDDLAGAFPAVGADDGHGVVEPDLAPDDKVGAIQTRSDVEVHLPSVDQDVDATVLVQLDDHPVGRRWLVEPFDLAAQRGDLLAGVLQGAHETFVLVRHRGQVRLAVAKLALQFQDTATLIGVLRTGEAGLLGCSSISPPGVLPSTQCRAAVPLVQRFPCHE